MDFHDTFTIPADPARVWTAMLDPDVMRQVLPGCRRLEQVGPERFDVTLAAGIGVLRGVFAGSVRFGDLEAPRHCSMEIGAQGSLGRVAGTGTIDLAPAGADTTLTYAATFTFAGPMAGLGESLMRNVAGALTREAVGRFSAVVQASAVSP
jgi:carbon monoxide dehydrogenase subunit G